MKSYSDPIKEVEVLTSQILDDNYSKEAILRLSHLLKSSREARKRYTELTIQDSLLHWESVDYENEAKAEKDQKIIISFPVISSIAAAVVALLSVWWIHSSRTKPIISQNIIQTDTFSNSESGQASFIDLRDEGFKGSLSISTFNLPPNSILGRFENSKNDAIYGLELLRSGKNFGEGGVVEFTDNVVSWKRSDHLSVPTENGILPHYGNKMIKFSTMKVDVNSQISETAELVQVVDVRNLKIGDKSRKAQLKTSVFFNKGIDLAGDSTEFALSLHAIASNENNQNASIGHQQVNLNSDLNPSTWEEVQQDFLLPNGTEFVIVSMSARKEGSSALLPDIGGHYANGLSVNILVDGKNTVGPL